MCKQFFGALQKDKMNERITVIKFPCNPVSNMNAFEIHVFVLFLLF